MCKSGTAVNGSNMKLTLPRIMPTIVGNIYTREITSMQYRVTQLDGRQSGHNKCILQALALFVK